MLRLKLRVERADGKRSIDVVALVNSGFISFEPELLLPASLAEQLELSKVFKSSTMERLLADGSRARLVKFPRSVIVKVVCDDRESDPVEASVLVAERASLPLVNDKLVGKLRVVILDAGEGLWCFRDELGKKIRRSL